MASITDGILQRVNVSLVFAGGRPRRPLKKQQNVPNKQKMHFWPSEKKLVGASFFFFFSEGQKCKFCLFGTFCQFFWGAPQTAAKKMSGRPKKTSGRHQAKTSNQFWGAKKTSSKYRLVYNICHYSRALCWEILGFIPALMLGSAKQFFILSYSVFMRFPRKTISCLFCFYLLYTAFVYKAFCNQLQYTKPKEVDNTCQGIVFVLFCVGHF